MVFVGDGEFEAVDDVGHARRLLSGPVDEHGLVSRLDLTGQGDDAIGGTDIDGKLVRLRPPLECAYDPASERVGVKRQGRRRRRAWNVPAQSPEAGAADGCGCAFLET